MITIIKHNNEKLVLSVENLIYKFSNKSKELETEYNFLKNNDFYNIVDPVSHYSMRLVNPISFHENHYVMKKLSGQMSHKSNIENDYFLAGCFLRTFHKFQLNSGAGEVGFGDFTMEHLFVNHDFQTVTAIDPGISHKTHNSLKQDIPRFLCKTLSGVFDADLKIKLIRRFFEGYGKKTVIDDVFLIEINKRIQTNYLKEVNENRFSIRTKIKAIIKKSLLTIKLNLLYQIIKK